MELLTADNQSKEAGLLPVVVAELLRGHEHISLAILPTLCAVEVLMKPQGGC